MNLNQVVGAERAVVFDANSIDPGAFLAFQILQIKPVLLHSEACMRGLNPPTLEYYTAIRGLADDTD
tara:strand:- start:28278 stop:28478 length:201 start_codon:yes stop_codon:yes gene_type:complete